MSVAEEIRRASAGMAAPELLRFLLMDRFPRRAVVTCSLRARSIVVLNMVAEIDPATRVIFCHAPDLYPESVAYRARIVERLRLTNVRIAGRGRSGPPPRGPGHVEDVWSDVPGGWRVHTLVHLNRLLAGFDCWISAVYHRLYGDSGMDRVVEEGGLVRIVDPLRGWDQEDVRAYMAERDLPPHPHVEPQRPGRSPEGSAVVPTYHY